MSNEEEILWQGSPSQWTNFWPFVLCILVIPIPRAIWRVISTRCFEYEVTTQRIRIRQGVFSRRTDSMAAAAGAYGHIRADLERAGRSIGPLDLLIAAHALSLGVTLVTNNVREFGRVKGLKGLKVANWAK